MLHTNDATMLFQLASVCGTPVICCGRYHFDFQLLFRVINIKANRSAERSSKCLRRNLIIFGRNPMLNAETHFADVHYYEDVKLLFLGSAWEVLNVFCL